LAFKLTYTAVDGARKQREFATIGIAASWAQHWVGRNPEFGRTYAISPDGIGKIEVNAGCELRKLFEFDAAPWQEETETDRRVEVMEAAKSGVNEYLKSMRGANAFGAGARVVDIKNGFVIVDKNDNRYEFTVLAY
jgi:hypothetical protein